MSIFAIASRFSTYLKDTHAKSQFELELRHAISALSSIYSIKVREGKRGIDPAIEFEALLKIFALWKILAKPTEDYISTTFWDSHLRCNKSHVSGDKDAWIKTQREFMSAIAKHPVADLEYSFLGNDKTSRPYGFSPLAMALRELASNPQSPVKIRIKSGILSVASTKLQISNEGTFKLTEVTQIQSVHTLEDVFNACILILTRCEQDERTTKDLTIKMGEHMHRLLAREYTNEAIQMALPHLQTLVSVKS